MTHTFLICATISHQYFPVRGYSQVLFSDKPRLTLCTSLVSLLCLICVCAVQASKTSCHNILAFVAISSASYHGSASLTVYHNGRFLRKAKSFLSYPPLNLAYLDVNRLSHLADSGSFVFLYILLCCLKLFLQLLYTFRTKICV